ncbi:MAG TPA: hypothetical protein VLG39_03170 [Nitrospirota bacterium]|nr:hypothetical protein [Nitrospirota bacterium]
MIIKNVKTFNIGALFAITFIGVLIAIFSPLFQGKNGLEFADNSFNKLAKGSSYFIPKVVKDNERFMGKAFTVSIRTDKPEDRPGDAETRAANIAKVFATAGAKVDISGSTLKIEGDLGQVLASALQDADAMFKNDGEKIRARYGTDDEKKMFRQWHNALSRMNKEFDKEKKIVESKMVNAVVKKAVEPAYNFYQIDANRVSDHAGMLSGLLVFYVFYTMWWGYAIFYMFEGFGLTMKKAKVKKEA